MKFLDGRAAALQLVLDLRPVDSRVPCRQGRRATGSSLLGDAKSLVDRRQGDGQSPLDGIDKTLSAEVPVKTGGDVQVKSPGDVR